MNVELLKAEVLELTALFRGAPDCEDLRILCRDKGVEPATALLVGFMESEDRIEYGALATGDGLLFEYERSTASRSAPFIKWVKIEDPESLIDAYPAAPVGVSMIKEGITG